MTTDHNTVSPYIRHWADKCRTVEQARREIREQRQRDGRCLNCGRGQARSETGLCEPCELNAQAGVDEGTIVDLATRRRAMEEC